MKLIRNQFQNLLIVFNIMETYYTKKEYNEIGFSKSLEAKVRKLTKEILKSRN